MLMLIASSFVIGALLGTKFRVFVLLPTIILGAVAIFLTNLLHPAAEICGAIVSYAITLQFGYLVGVGSHHVGTTDSHDDHLSTGITLAPPAH
jgi:hypothetical protein